jgi:hypothetical protein
MVGFIIGGKLMKFSADDTLLLLVSSKESWAQMWM